MPAANASRFKVLHRFGPPMLITLGVLWILQATFASTASHGVLIRNLHYDAGTVKAGSTVTDTVRLINLSSVPVEVDAQPGCGCTVVDVPDKPLAPLHTEVVKLAINTVGLQLGNQRKGVILQMRSRGSSWQQVADVMFRVQ